MFTGIIEKICPVKAFNRKADAAEISIDLGELADDAKLGDSIAVDGVCLTISKLTGQIARFDVSAESLKKSTLKNLNSASKANAERALSLGSRLGGHIVQGHIDGTAVIKSIKPQGDFYQIIFTPQTHLLDDIIPKGSIAIDGISLTIASMDAQTFTVAVIPTTWNHTTLSTKKINDTVNVETDIIGKVIKKQLHKILPEKQGLTFEKLRELGF